MDLLPTEICIRILNELPSTEAGVRALARCSMTGNSTLRVASLEPMLWKLHYKYHYTHAECEKEAERRSRLRKDWRRMYQERRRLDREVLENLRIIEASSSETRIEPARRIVSLGLDVWDALSEESTRPVPAIFQKEEDIEKVKEGSPLTNLARKYWASELLKIVARRNAIDRWISLKRVLSGEETNPLSFEEAFASLSSFHGVLSDEIMDHINREADGCRRYLEGEGIPYVLGTEGFETTRLCNAICAYMRSQGFEKASPNEFYDFRNSLPHVFMTSSRRSLPISLVVIFVAIAKRLGLEASALNTPNCVTALVRDTVVDVTQMEPDSILAIINYEEIKDIFGLTRQMTMTTQLLARAARNIGVAGVQETTRIMPNDPYQDDTFYMSLQARYLSFCLSALTDSIPEYDAGECIASVIGSKFFPLDLELVVHDKQLPYSSVRRTNVNRYYEDNDDRSTAIILEGNLPIASQGDFDNLFVGQIVVTKNSVLRCIIGWKKKDAQILCSTIAYCHHFVKDFPLTAVTPITCSARDLNSFLQNPILGQFFEDAEVQELNVGTNKGRGRFIMNKGLIGIYPDDDVRGARWVRGES